MEIIRKPGGLPWNMRKHGDPRKDFKGFAEAPKRYEEEVETHGNTAGTSRHSKGEAKLNRH